MVLAFAGYVIGSGTHFLIPEAVDAVAWVYAGPLVGELAFCLWLILKGVRVSAG